MKKGSDNRSGSLHRRWLTNTVGIILALGLVCVMAATATFAFRYYSQMEWDMKYLADSTAAHLQDYAQQTESAYYDACVNYTRTFLDKDGVNLQFLDTEGCVIANSRDFWAGEYVDSPEVMEAVSSRGAVPFVGKDVSTGQRSMIIATPAIYSNGEIIGLFRFSLSTWNVERQILLIAMMGLVVLMVLLTVVFISSTYYIRSIMGPVAEISEKAKRIANGSYGTQIQTRYQDEIGELAETINELSAKISQNEKMQAEFISQLSHELRTPLTVINGWSETLLADETMDEGTQQGMKIISSEAKRLTEMVMELLDFTRMQDGRMTLSVEMTDIRSEFEDTVFMYSSRLSQDGIALDYIDTDDYIPDIPCDAKRLRQVFLNILDNAAKHGGEGKRIDAAIFCEDDTVVVRIRDYGPGIPEDEIPLVKKKFYKGSSKARGTGIGLAVCDEIVELHGGTLTLENAEGGGTLVTICLPAGES